VDASLTGLGQHKFKSINVEANLLDTWSVKRSELENKIRQRMLAIVALCALGAVLIPVVAAWQGGMSSASRKAKTDLAAAHQERIKLDEIAKTLAPSIQFEGMVSQSKGNSTLVLREFAKVVNAAPLDVVFSSLKLEVLAGDCTMRITAEANNSDLGRQFVERAGKGQNVVDSMQTAVRRSTTFGANGVSFDYIKRVRFEH
jgi:hypothetical protein